MGGGHLMWPRRRSRRGPPQAQTEAFAFPNETGAGLDRCQAVDWLCSSVPSNEKATASSVRLSHAQQERFRAADSNQRGAVERQ